MQWNKKKIIIYKQNEKKHSVIIIGPRGENDRGTVWFFSQPQININTFTIVVIIIIIDMVVWLFVTILSSVECQLVTIFLNHLSLVQQNIHRCEMRQVFLLCMRDKSCTTLPSSIIIHSPLLFNTIKIVILST